MSDEKVPRFLQQTTSQLLHQQEALRKRREMLERESTKPPAMRFGTSSPPRSHSRHGKSPVPVTSLLSSINDCTASHSTPPRGDNVHRELNWSKTDDDAVAERAPMRFSMTFRPGPTPVASGRPRAGTQLHVPLSPSPREVNTADRVSPASRKVTREVSTPRAASLRSPSAQRLRQEDSGTSVENFGGGRHNAHVPVQILVPVAKSRSRPEETVAVNTTENKPDAAPEVLEDEEAQEPTRAEKRCSLPPPPPFCFEHTAPATAAMTDPQERPSDNDDTGIAGFSNTFAVPRFTPSTPLATARTGTAKPSSDEREGEEAVESDSTPGRPAVGEFRTPRPVTRMSTSLTPIVYGDSTSHASSTAVEDGNQQKTGAGPVSMNEDAEAKARNREDSWSNGTTEPVSAAVRHAASPAPTPSQLLSSCEASTEKRGGAAPTPAMSRDHDDEQKEGETDGRVNRSLSHLINPASASRSTELRTPSPTRRTKASPAPTAQDLVQSVQVSAERRTCGCERPTPSPEHWHRHRSSQSRPTASPQPTPVPPSDKPMTEFDSPNHKCCDRPTPVSLSSQPAGGEARVTATSSASPWPTTENIISSILAGAQEEQRRAREAAGDARDDAGDNDTATSERFSNEEGGDREEPRPGRWEKEPHSPTNVPTHTPSPVPSERQYGQSVLASAEKRRCGRPTPDEREVSPAPYRHHQDSGSNGNSNADIADTSASPQPSAHHLLDSLDVSSGKNATRGKPAEPENEEEAQMERDATRSNGRSANDQDVPRKDMRTPSPTPTPEHVISSLQASAEKRTRSAAVHASTSSSDNRPNWRSVDSSAMSNSFQSPTLTAQNVKDSVQKLMADKQQTRSDAQAPQRPWGESRPSTSETHWNSSASPVVTAEDVDMSLASLEKDRRRQCRSARAERDSQEAPSASPESKGTTHCAAEESEQPVSPQAALPQQPLPTATATSPAASDFVVQSAMFFDCVSAPITPSLPTAETIALSEITYNTTTTSYTSTVSGPCVPAEFLELQREVIAISEGRSRTHTPPPLRASETCSPVKFPPPTASETVGGDGETEACRRSSLVLVHPTRSHPALIQHPHEPVPVMPPPSISPVQVPRTPTPPPRHAGHPTDQQRPEESPLPRPVSLRSQVSLPKHPLSAAKAPQSRSPVPIEHVFGAHTDDGNAGTYGEEEEAHQSGAKGTTETAVCAPRPRTAATDAAEEENDDIFDAKNDWMDLVEPLRQHTITVSPQRGAVVYTLHAPRSAEGNGDGKREEHDSTKSPPSQHLSSPPQMARKRSRSADTPPAAQRNTRATIAMTPASVALTMDDGTSTCSKSSGLLTHTPSSCVSRTPRSSPRGRRSQAEELMAMLPADVAAEVLRMDTEKKQEDDALIDEEESASGARLSAGSPASRLSGLSNEDDLSTTAQMSTISGRVSRRPQRVRRSDDYYAQYLEEVTRSSAKKVRVAAGRRMHKAIQKDLAQQEEQGGTHTRASTSAKSTPEAVSPPQPRCRRSRSSSAQDSSSQMLSPMTPSPVHGDGPTQLQVTTHLSTKVRQALFRDPPANEKAKKAKKAVAASVKRGSTAKAAAAARLSPQTPSPSSSKKAMSEKKTKAPGGRRGKKVVRKFVTAKSLRSAHQNTKAKKKH